MPDKLLYGIHRDSIFRDKMGDLWEIAGFIDRPAIIIRRIEGTGQEATHVIESIVFRENYTELRPQIRHPHRQG